ncbi:MAG: hypothetical protein M3198_19375, partial [Actinomycetota bacterium]|nr:hypothetical protein [Actinomycetota bacterium]
RVRPATIRHQADLAVSRSIKETHETEKSRYLEWSWDLDGAALDFQGRLPAHEGAMFIDAIDSLAKDLPEHPDKEHELMDLELDDKDLQEMAQALDPYGEEGLLVDASPLGLSLTHRRADALALLVAGDTPKKNTDTTVSSTHASRTSRDKTTPRDALWKAKRCCIPRSPAD